MKVVILAGGFGTRLAEYTDRIPKPMLEIHNKPILLHIIESYNRQGFDEFVIALGYKADYIKNYFLRLLQTSGDFEIDYAKREYLNLSGEGPNYKVQLIDTGENALTGDRLLRLKPYLKERFMFTYGDGLANINLSELLDFHKINRATVTITAVRPRARFGAIKITDSGQISEFKEKPQTEVGRINGGFMVMEPEVFDYLAQDQCTLEKEPLENLAAGGKLAGFKHDGFWHCIDTKRDLDEANGYDTTKYPWAL